MSKTTQREAVLQLLKERGNKYTPVYWFIGEKYSGKYGWVFLSHRAPARLTELYQDGLLERKQVKGKTGAYYYSYKIRKD